MTCVKRDLHDLIIELRIKYHVHISTEITETSETMNLIKKIKFYLLVIFLGPHFMKYFLIFSQSTSFIFYYLEKNVQS